MNRFILNCIKADLRDLKQTLRFIQIDDEKLITEDKKCLKSRFELLKKNIQRLEKSEVEQ